LVPRIAPARPADRRVHRAGQRALAADRMSGYLGQQATGADEPGPLRLEAGCGPRPRGVLQRPVAVADPCAPEQAGPDAFQLEDVIVHGLPTLPGSDQ